LALTFAASAQGKLPDGVQVFTVDDHTCVMSEQGFVECFCPCSTCQTVAIKTPESPTPDGPTPTPAITPPPDDRQPCNRGIGNNSEGCDPGNSLGRGGGQGRDAGEDRNENKR